MLEKMKRKSIKSIVLASTLAITGSTLMVVGSPSALAYGGSEDPATGIVRGVATDGSYMVPLEEGGELEGWCIDPGAAYPKQGGVTLYGAPIDFNVSDPEDKKQLISSLFLGKAIIDGTIDQGKIDLAKQFVPPPIYQPLGFNDNPFEGVTVDDLAAGVSAVVHEVGAKYGDGRGAVTFDPQARLTTDGSKRGYALAKRFAQLVPGQLTDAAGIDLKMRVPVDPNSRKQRMIIATDIDIPTFELPSFDIPDIDTPPNEDIPPNPKTPTPPAQPQTPNLPPTTNQSTPPPSTDTSTTTPPDKPSKPKKDTPTTKTIIKKTKSSETTPFVPQTSSSTTTKKKDRPRVPETTSEKPEEPEISIRTSAGTKAENIVEKGRTITDTVTYQGLKPDTEYRLVGELVDKQTQRKTGDKGEIKFKTKTANGKIDINIPVNTAASDEVVVFETLYEGDKKVASHEDLNDKAQTVGRPRSVPEIRTSVASSTGNNIQSGTVVNDTVRFRGLVPGRKYRLEARLICKATAQDTGAKQTHEFVPNSANGETVVQNIAVTDPDCLQQVAFEKLYEVKDKNSGLLVATHEDLNDVAQTFGGEHVGKKKKKKKVAPEETPKKANKPERKPEPVPVRVQVVPEQVPAPIAPGGGLSPAPRQIINAVPSGEASNYGNTIFNR